MNIVGEETYLLNGLKAHNLMDYLDVGAFYGLIWSPFPSTLEQASADLESRGLVAKMADGSYSIRAAGALLLARDFSFFPSLFNKGVRVIRYKGNGRVYAQGEVEFKKGYASSFEEMMTYIMGMVPQEEIIEGGLRKQWSLVPEKAIREGLLNLCMHQDFSVNRRMNFVEIFDNRVEITSAGSLLVPKDRILDSLPHSRNEIISSFMRLSRLSEARGSGFDRMEDSMAMHGFPSPKVEAGEDYTKIILLPRRILRDWSEDEKCWTAYIHVCYCYVNGDKATNQSIRSRFLISEENKSLASRIINLALESGKIKLADPMAGPRKRAYIPYWA